jgi:hypothetical protein
MLSSMEHEKEKVHGKKCSKKYNEPEPVGNVNGGWMVKLIK